MSNTMKIGVVGCGNIAGAYMNYIPKSPNIEVAGCADIDADKTQAFADKYSIKAMTVDELMGDDGIDIVLNLTIPGVHGKVNMQALASGKHAYCEKPLAVDLDEGAASMKLASEKGLRLGCAPDTFFGGGVQTCRKLIDDGAIGQPVAATAFLACHGHESWHPSPEFYYKPGGGPMLDMGPYYLTALVNLLGPVNRVCASTRTTFPTRTITSKPLNGTVIDVEVTTHLAGTVDFECGAIGTVIMSFDTWKHHLPRIEIYGTTGSLVVPDPNGFGGKVELWTTDNKEWTEVELTHTPDNGRGIGLADMAKAIMDDRPHRASGELALHVLDIMTAFDRSSEAGQHVMIENPCQRPAALPAGLPAGEVD